MNAKGTVLKKIYISFIITFCLGKYRFSHFLLQNIFFLSFFLSFFLISFFVFSLSCNFSFFLSFFLQMYFPFFFCIFSFFLFSLEYFLSFFLSFFLSRFLSRFLSLIFIRKNTFYSILFLPKFIKILADSSAVSFGEAKISYAYMFSYLDIKTLF